jgi:hypothetical protein
MNRLFGWSYPPGCSGPPDDDIICEICLKNVDKGECVCPECPVCGEYGDPECYLKGHMEVNDEQIKMNKEETAKLIEEARQENLMWEDCKPTDFDIFD